MNLDLTFIQSILSFFLVLTPIVFFHELGHFMAARFFGVNVEIFSVGFGPSLFSFVDNKGTRWQLAAIPIGGFVKMEGEFTVASPSNESQKHSGAFQFANVWKRIAIVIAGPLANVFLAIILIAGIYLFFGRVEIPNTINSIMPNSAAEIGGLAKNDRIVKIDNINVNGFEDIRQIVMENPGKELKFEIIRNEFKKILFVTPQSLWNDELKINIGQLGVVSDQGSLTRYGISQSMYLSTLDTFNIAKSMIRGVSRLITGNIQKGEIGGPVRIAELSGQAFVSGWLALFYFCALISLNLGLINLFPIPALDGGHLILYFIEVLIGRPLPVKIQNFLMRTGISFLLALMVIVTFFDISRYF